MSETNNNRRNKKVSSMALCAILIALSIVLSEIKIIHMPFGGSLTLFSMLAATLTGYFCGPKWGITSGVALGLLNMAIDPTLLFPVQVILDYILAFGCLGLSGFFKDKKGGLYIGYIVAVLGRFLCSFLSGFIFFGEYAPEGMNPIIYSFLYNILYMGGEAILTLVLLAIPAVHKTLERLKFQMN